MAAVRCPKPLSNQASHSSHSDLAPIPNWRYRADKELDDVPKSFYVPAAQNGMIILLQQQLASVMITPNVPTTGRHVVSAKSSSHDAD